MLLQGKTALITGASRGIGKEIARRFIEEGAAVWGLATKPSETSKELATLALEKGTVYHELIADIGNPSSVQPVITEAVKASGGFSVLVNNAGITKDGLSFRMKLEDWEAVLRINLTGTFLVTQIVSSDMIRKRAGSIINSFEHRRFCMVRAGRLTMRRRRPALSAIRKALRRKQPDAAFA